MMNLLSLLLVTIPTLIASQQYELIADHKDIANGYFSTNLKTTGLENEDDPTANTYSIIGKFDAAKRSQYTDSNGAYGFKLIYRYSDGTTDELIWTQTSWITDASVTGADLSQIPDQTGKAVQNRFGGLALSTSSATYLDGSDFNTNWFHSVGVNTPWSGGLPGDREGQSAYSMSLYIKNPNDCSSAPCADDLICVGNTCQRDCKVLDIDAFLRDCSSEFGANEADIDKLKTDVDTNKGSIGSLDTRVTTNENDIDTIETKVGNNEKDVGALDTRLTKAEGDIDALETKASDNKDSITALTGRVSTNEGAISGLDGKMTNAQADISTNKGDISGLDTRLKAAESDISTNKGDISGLDTRLKAAEGDITTNKGSISGLDTRVTNNENSIKDAETDIGDLQKDVEAINNILDKLSAQSPGSNFMPENGDENYGDKGPMMSVATKDLVIAFLLVLNIVLLCVMAGLWIKSGKNHSKYNKVRGYETEENIQLNH